MNKSKRIFLIVSYVMLGMLFFFNICASVYFYTTNDTDRIFENNILKVVEVKTSDDEISWGYATGAFISNNGKILTNKHVVFNSSTNNNYQTIKVRLATVDEWIDAEILQVSADYDLAIIKINMTSTSYFKIDTNVKNGESIYTIGNPNGFGLSFASGVISSNLRNVIYNGTTIQAIQTSLVINEGNSGGPVFNKAGNLLGLISFRLKDKKNDVIQGVSFAVPASVINDFILN